MSGVVTVPFARDSECRMSTEQGPRKTGSGLVFVTHNWCDPTTWYTQSKRITDETLVNSGDNLTFTSQNPNWIDLVHGKIYREDLISEPYLPVIEVNGETKICRKSWSEDGGDFNIDYKNGTVTFFTEQLQEVTASYSYADGCLFIVAPADGKKLWIEYSEVQFSLDVDVKSNINFQPWAYNPHDLPNKIPVSQATIYKTLDNYIEEANGSYPVVPAMDKTRGFKEPRLAFPFRYPVVKELFSSYGLEIRIWLDDDIPFGGEYSTATFYCTSYDE